MADDNSVSGGYSVRAITPTTDGRPRLLIEWQASGVSREHVNTYYGHYSIIVGTNLLFSPLVQSDVITGITSHGYAILTGNYFGEHVTLSEVGEVRNYISIFDHQAYSDLAFDSAQAEYVYPSPWETDKGVLPIAYYHNPRNRANDPVEVTSGSFYINQVDLHVNGPMPIEVRRTYSSLNSTYSEYGYGWLPGYNSYVIPSDDLATITAADMEGSVTLFRRVGSSDTWRPTVADNPTIASNGGGATNPLNGVITRTEPGGSGTGYVYAWQSGDGSVRTYVTRSFPVIFAGETAYRLRQRPYLSTWADNRGNYLTFDYGSTSTANDYGRIKQVNASNGTSVAFTYDAKGHLTQATAGDGRTVIYTYSSTSLDLLDVQLPDGKHDGYGYSTDGNHVITFVATPDNRTLQNVYDSSLRVTAQNSTADTTNPAALVQTAGYDYSVAGQTTVTDANGHATVYHYADGLMTQITDPLGQSVTNTWYTSTGSGGYQRSLHTVTDHRGLVTTYTYDSQGNITQTEVTGDLDGDPETSETSTISATYNSLNLPTSLTDAAGVATTFSYDDTDYPYLPTQIVTSKDETTLRTDKLEYTEQVDGVNPSIVSKGLVARKTTAYGTSDAAVVEYTYNPAGFVIQQKSYTGTSDPDVVMTFDYNNRGELITGTDGDGRKTVYTYDGNSRQATKNIKNESNVSLGIWTTSYNHYGQLVSSSGPRTPTDQVSLTYDGVGRLKTRQVRLSTARTNGTGLDANPANVFEIYSYDHAGNMLASKDVLGRETDMTYDNAGQMVSKSVAGLSTESFLYEPGGKLSQYTNPLGGITKSFYTANGQLRRQENPDGSVLEWRYATDGRIVKEVMRNGSYRETAYDDVAHTVTQTLKNSDGVTLATEVKAYDLRGNLISYTDREGFVRTNTYDGLDRIKTATGPAGVTGSDQQTTTTIYGASGKTASVRNGLDETVTTTTDALGRPVLTEVKDASDAVVRTTSYGYSSDHNAVTVTQGSGTGSIAQTTYTDTRGNPVLNVAAGGKFVRQTYDTKGNLLSVTDQLGQTTSYAYDALDRVSSQTLPDGTVTTFTYDAAGNVLTRGMAGGTLSHQQTYDNAGRKLTEQLATTDSSTRSYSYSYYTSGAAKGLLQTVTGPRNTVTTTYDDFLRPDTVTTAGSLDETNGTTTYTYDRRNLVTSVSENSTDDAAGPATVVNRAYDGYRQLVSETVTIGGDTHSSVTQTWDAAGRRGSLDEASANPSDPLFAYQYRADGRMTRVTSGGDNYDFGYGNNGLLTGRTNPFRTLTIDTRDSRGRITQQTAAVGGVAALVENMTWRDNSTLATYAADRTGTGSWDETRAYTYNARGQLLSEGFSPAAGQSDVLTYAFDGNTTKLGIRLDAKVGTGTPSSWENNVTTVNGLARVTAEQVSAITTFIPANGVAFGADHVDILVDSVAQGRATYAGVNDSVGAWTKSLYLPAGSHTLTARAVHSSGHTASSESTFTVTGNVGANPGGAVTVAYDDAGNVATRTWAAGLTQTLTWDAFNRLIKIAQRDGDNNGYDWTAVYDGFGRRLKTVQQAVEDNAASGDPSVTTSIYDPEVEFLEIGVAVNGDKAWKVYGPDLDGDLGSLQGTGGLEATIVEGGATKGVLSDRWGNGVASVSSGGTVSWFATRVSGYGPLPGVTIDPLTDITHLAEATAWRSRRIDPTGLICLGARYYDPTSARFLSADPAGHAASMSLYDYCNGDPVNSFDPDGRTGNDASFANNLLSGLWAGSAKGLISAAQGVKSIAEFATGLDWIKTVAPDSPYARFSRAMDEEGEWMKQQVEENIVGLTGADNKTSYVFAAGSVAGEAGTAYLLGKAFTPGETPVQNIENATVTAERTAVAAEKTTATVEEASAELSADGTQSAGEAAENSAYRGGAHREMTAPKNDGLDSHHMPDRNADPGVSVADGPAIQMDPIDHKATSSYGPGRAPAQYRAETAEMIAKGEYRDAMAREVRDVRNAAREASGDATKYNRAMQEMLNYAKSSGQLPTK